MKIILDKNKDYYDIGKKMNSNKKNESLIKQVKSILNENLKNNKSNHNFDDDLKNSRIGKKQFLSSLLKMKFTTNCKWSTIDAIISLINFSFNTQLPKDIRSFNRSISSNKSIKLKYCDSCAKIFNLNDPICIHNKVNSFELNLFTKTLKKVIY